MLGGLLAVFVAGLALVQRSRSADRLANGGELVVWLSGDTRGYLEPCGCRRDQAGGLPARMTLIAQDHAPNRLLLDVGNMTSGSRSYELLKFDYVLRGMAAMGYDAVNLGRREADLDRDTLLQKLHAFPLPFVSCNLLDRQTGKPVAAPSLVKTVGGARIGITGVVQMDPEEVGPGLMVRPPQEALAEILPGLRAQSDFVIVLVFAPEETLDDIASKFPEAGAVLGGDVPQSSGSAETVNRAVVFSVTDKGKVIGRLAFRRTPGGEGLALASARALKTADTIPPAPAMTALIRQFKADLRARNIELAAEEGLDPISAQQTTADTYAGQDRCQGCHATAYHVALASAHAHAYETLIQKGSEYDPECLRCHTVGYGARDGFVNLQTTPRLAGVQCESCHGRGTEHIKAIQSGKQGRAATLTLRAVTPNSCVRCHDAENSADFHFATFWPKIKHGFEPGMKN
ncbi:MAG TPA: multiheme c-type cytochrome [Chthonomonadaceae bacterium]|nr:multiheme c-type cytochrome [Chthonomonadaceae bacterium]